MATTKLGSATPASDSDDRQGCENGETTCVVCFHNVEIYSVGECDHPVCYECSTRMRALCDQNECPFCRQNVAKVIFSTVKLPFRQLDANLRSGLYDKRHRICFADLQVQKAFYNLLANCCPKCPHRPTFTTFDLLKRHVSREHELFYCDLCSDHLKIFSSERRCYTRAELALHKRKGDPDDKSHRGHPLCEYCDVRYLDRDELFKHLRREHFFCHFCDADGSNQFYADYPALRDHFQQEHYVCDEGECAREQLTGVFRTEIDLTAHKAKHHSSGLGKMAAKQARTLELEFSLVPRNNGRQGNGHPGGGDRTGSNHNHHNDFLDEPGPSHMPIQVRPRVIDSRNEQEFPTLGGGPAAANATAASTSSRNNNVSIRTQAFKTGNLSRTNENFPALGGGSMAPLAMAGSTKKLSTSALLKTKPPQQAPASASSAKGTVIHISNRPKGQANTDLMADFPLLSGGRNTGGAALLSSGSNLLPSSVEINKNALSAKHRNLVDEYTIASAVAQKTGPKVALVSAATPINGTDSAATNKKSQAKLKLQSDENFPSLSGLASNMPAKPTWLGAQTSNTTKAKVESRKAKVAPAPSTMQVLTKKDRKVKTNVEAKAKTETTNSTKPTAKSKEDISSPVIPNGGSGSGSNSVKSKSNGQPPPGFQAKAKGAPPGFDVTLNSIARPANGSSLTFTNSTGESYNIVPCRRYLPPPNVKERNQVLVRNFQTTFNDPLVFDEFRQYSQMFRENSYHALPYYEHCQSALGEKFEEVFTELLALLPDINKQQELYLVYCQKHLQGGGSKGAKKQKLSVCNICKQVLQKRDVEAHNQSHTVEQDFPKL